MKIEHKNEKDHRKAIIRLIVPCYNEDANIKPFYNRVKRVIQKYDYSILFIDDGSTDRTLFELDSLSIVDSRVIYISLSRNFGQQNALKAGCDYSTDVDCVISMDADLQHPPEIIEGLIEKWKEGYKIVNTVRQGNHKTPFLKRIAATLFYRAINYISRTQIIPNGPDFRLLDKKVVKVICAINESNIYLKELIPWMGFKQFELTFHVEKRFAGISKYSLKKQISTAARGITSFSINPLRLSSLIGVGFALLSFLYGIYAIIIFFFTNNAVPGWTSLMASILFMAGIQFILIGIIGEYLGRTFLETKKRPLYIVEEASVHIEKEVFHSADNQMPFSNGNAIINTF